MVFTWSILRTLRRWSENTIKLLFLFKYNSFAYLKWEKCCKKDFTWLLVIYYQLSEPIPISWLSFMHQIGKSHAGCIIKVVLALLLSPVSCASFPNVDDHSGCVLTLINLAAHHDKPGVWWEMAKSAEESARHQTAKVWALNVESAVRAGADSPQRSQRKQWSHKSATVPNQAVIQRSSSPQMYWVWRMMPTSWSLGAMRTTDHLR